MNSTDNSMKFSLLVEIEYTYYLTTDIKEDNSLLSNQSDVRNFIFRQYQLGKIITIKMIY